LHHSNAAALFDRYETGGAIIERAGQHHTNHLWPVRQRCRTKQRIDGWTVAVFFRAAHDAHAPTLNEKMVIWWRNIDMTRLDRHVICRLKGW
jgi:hypothetical protein